MAGADGIDVVLLHQPQVRDHIRHADGGSRPWMGIVAIYPLQGNGRCVDTEYPIHYPHVPQSHMVYNHLAIAGKHRLIQPGGFCRPEFRIVHRQFQGRICPFHSTGNGISLGVQQAQGGRLRLMGQGIFHPKSCFAIIFRKLCGNFEIIETLTGSFQDVYIPENTAEPEFILAFKVGTQAPFQVQNRQTVLSPF